MLFLFVLVPVVFAAVFAAAWLLAGQLVEWRPELAALVYSRIGVGAMVGGVSGGLMAKSVSLLLEPRFLVLAGALSLMAASFAVSNAHRLPLFARQTDGKSKLALRRREHEASLRGMLERPAH